MPGTREAGRETKRIGKGRGTCTQFSPKLGKEVKLSSSNLHTFRTDWRSDLDPESFTDKSYARISVELYPSGTSSGWETFKVYLALQWLGKGSGNLWPKGSKALKESYIPYRHILGGNGWFTKSQSSVVKSGWRGGFPRPCHVDLKRLNLPESNAPNTYNT